MLLRAVVSFLGMVALLCGLGGLWAHRAAPDAFERTAKEWTQTASRWIDQPQVPEAQRPALRVGLEWAGKGALALREPAAFGSLIALALTLLFAGRRGAARPARKGKDAAHGGERERESGPARGKGADVAPAQADSGDSQHSAKDIRRLTKQAVQLQAEHGAEAAGDFLLDEGLRQEAFDLFVREGMHGRAAEVRHDQNRFEEAAELYEKAGKTETAAAIYAQIERFEDAARCYLTAEKNSIAAEMYERAGKHRQAGECYRAIGFGRHAAQAFLKAGSEAAAAECLVGVFNEEHAIAVKTEGKLTELRGFAKKAGEILFKLERLDEAEEILTKAGIYGPAAKIAFQRGAYERAAQLFGRVGRGDLQAKAFEKIGDTAGAARALGSYLREQGQTAEAADQFLAAGDHAEAAGLFRALDRYADAGEAYMTGNDYGAAAEMFRAAEALDRAGAALEKAQRFAEAAQCFAQAGDTSRQAELLERAGQLFAAGTVHAEQARTDEAIRLLQRVEPDDPQYSRACAMVGRLFKDKGMDALAIAKLEQATQGAAVSKANAEPYYDLACLQQARGEHAQAIAAFEKILAFDYRYGDVAQRLEACKSAVPLPAATQEAMLGRSGRTADDQQRYRVIREIGRGGMGVVYLARDVLLERDVAYKVLPEQLRESPDALRGFLREAKAAAQLNHPNIVTVYDVGESEHGFYMAMEFVEGTTLKAVVQKRGPIAPGGVMYVLRQMGEALGYAHGKKVVHRDIKTSNIMWTADKQVKIMDFGLAKLMEEVRNATTTISGTPFYMSPEQTLGRNVDHRTDLYSLGVTLFELATGELPFRKGNVPYHHVHTPPRDPREINAELPGALAEVILRCLQKAPEDRYGSAREMVDDLAKRIAEAPE